MNAVREEFTVFPSVIERLNALAPERQTSLQHTGGGIFCVEVRTAEGFAWFGVEADTWGANIYRNDEYESSIDIGIPSSTKDANQVARAIPASIVERDRPSD